MLWLWVQFLKKSSRYRQATLLLEFVTCLHQQNKKKCGIVYSYQLVCLLALVPSRDPKNRLQWKRQTIYGQPATDDGHLAWKMFFKTGVVVAGKSCNKEAEHIHDYNLIIWLDIEEIITCISETTYFKK